MRHALTDAINAARIRTAKGDGLVDGVGPVFDYAMCGLHVRSGLPLPRLVGWTSGDHSPDVVIRLGPVDAIASGEDRYFTVDPDDSCRLDVPGVARFLVRDGREIVVHTDLPRDAPDLAAFLLGSVFGFLCHQRALLPLHASCVAINGSAVAFAGLSGAGKSTLAAKLVALGHALLADDVTVIQATAQGPLVVPSFPHQKLWADSIDALGLERGRAIRSIDGFQKFEHGARRFASEPLPLAAICHLEPDAGKGRDMLTPIRGLEAVHRMRAAIYRLAAGRRIAGGDGRLMLAAAETAAAVPQFGLRRPTAFAALPEFAHRLVERLGETV